MKAILQCYFSVQYMKADWMYAEMHLQRIQGPKAYAYVLYEKDFKWFRNDL